MLAGTILKQPLWICGGARQIDPNMARAADSDTTETAKDTAGCTGMLDLAETTSIVLLALQRNAFFLVNYALSRFVLEFNGHFNGYFNGHFNGVAVVAWFRSHSRNLTCQTTKATTIAQEEEGKKKNTDHVEKIFRAACSLPKWAK